LADTDNPVTDDLSTTGAAAMSTDRTADSLPALSTAMNCTVCAAAALATVNGALYGNHAPDVPTRYDRDATPEVSSDATNDTVTGSSPSRFAPTSGTSVSTFSSIDLVASTLPSASVDLYCTDCAPCTSIVTG